MWSASEPVVRDWITKNLGPVGMMEDAKDGLIAARRLVHLLPEMAERAESLSLDMEALIKNGMQLDAATTEAIGKAEARNNRWGHLGIWAIAALGAYWVFFS